MDKTLLISNIHQLKEVGPDTSFQEFSLLGKSIIYRLYPTLYRDEVMFLVGRLKFSDHILIDTAIELLDSVEAAKQADVSRYADIITRCLFGHCFMSFEKVVRILSQELKTLADKRRLEHA